MMVNVKDYLDRVVAGYLEAVDFTEGDRLEPPNDDTPILGFGDQIENMARDDCADFLDACLRANLNFLQFDPGPEWPVGYGPEQLGIDFWLTRNRHGAGFWDRGLGEIGDKLTDLAHIFGEQEVYVGDDGWCYFAW